MEVVRMMVAEFKRVHTSHGDEYRVNIHSERKTDEFEMSHFTHTPRQRIDRRRGPKVESILLFKHNHETIRVRVGERFKIGAGVYEVLPPQPKGRWHVPMEHGHEKITLKLVQGQLIPDFHGAAKRDHETREVLVTICRNTLAQFYTPSREE